MSLPSDFSMYYSGTVVRAQGGLPFIIQGVDRGNGPREALTSLRFTGDLIIDGSGNRERAVFAYSDVDFNLPTLGWRMIGGKARWVTYRPYKTVKKGIHPVRLANFHDRDFTRENIYQLFQSFPGRISDDWCTVGNDLLFKGSIVGTKLEDESLQLLSAARYLQPRLEAQVTSTPITIQ